MFCVEDKIEMGAYEIELNRSSSVQENKIMNERFMLDCLEELGILTHPKSFQLYHTVCDLVDRMGYKHPWEETVFKTLKQFASILK